MKNILVTSTIILYRLMDGSKVFLTIAVLGTLLVVSLLAAMKAFITVPKNGMSDQQQATISLVPEMLRPRKELNFGNFNANTCYEPKSFKPKIILQTRKLGYDFRAITKKLNNEKVAMDDARLLSVIRNYWIYNPSLKQYKFYDNRIDYSSGQSSLVDSLLNNKVSITDKIVFYKINLQFCHCSFRTIIL